MIPVTSNRFQELTQADLDVLRQRARELARHSNEQNPGELLELLEIESRGQRFAIPLDAVEGVAEVSSVAIVPRCPRFVRGLVGFRGEVLVCVELSALVSSSDKGFADLRRIVALTAGRRKLALLAEKSMVVRPVPAASFRSGALVKSSFVVGTDETFLSLLEPGALIEYTFRALAGGTP